jgi:hypothetical protein
MPHTPITIDAAAPAGALPRAASTPSFFPETELAPPCRKEALRQRSPRKGDSDDFHSLSVNLISFMCVSTEQSFSDLPDLLQRPPPPMPAMEGESPAEADGGGLTRARDGVGNPAIIADRTPEKKGVYPAGMRGRQKKSVRGTLPVPWKNRGFNTHPAVST